MSVQPVRSKIIAKQIGDSGEWEIPAKKGVNFLMVFGVFFGGIPLLMISLVIYGAFFGDINTTADSAFEAVMMIIGVVIFAGIFMFIGFGVAYLAYKEKNTSYKVSVRRKSIEVVKRFRGKETKERVEAGNIYGVGMYESSETNNRPNYGLYVRPVKGDGIKFYTGATEEEQRWLASEMMTALSRQGGLLNEEKLAQMHFTSNIDGGVSQGGFSKGIAHMYQLEGNPEEFVLEVNTSKVGKGMVLGGLLGTIFGGFFTGIAFFTEDGPFIFGIVGSILMLVFLAVLISGISKLGTKLVYTFLKDRVQKEKFRGQSSQSKVSFLRTNFSKLKMKNTGSSNGKARYSIVLEAKEGNENIKFFNWVDEEIAEAVKCKVRSWLEPEEDNVADESIKNSMEGNGGYGSSMKVDKPDDAVKLRAQVFEANDVRVYHPETKLSDTKGGIWVARAFIGLFLFIGIGALIFGILNFIKAKDSESWINVDGVVLSSEVSVNHSDDSTTYGADVSYRYRINGKEYKGDNVTVSEVSTSSRSRAKKIVARYPVGKDVAVYYDPDDPSDSVLERGVSGASWFLPAFGLGFIIIPGVILFFIEKSHKEEKRKKR